MVLFLFPRGSNSLIIVIDNKSLYMTVKTLNFRTRIFFFFSFQKLLLNYLKVPTVNLPFYRYLSNCQLQSSFQLSRKQKSAEECEMQADVAKSRDGREGGRRGLAVGLPSATHATKCQEDYRTSERGSGGSNKY